MPEGTTFRSQTVREALRDAMAEEMRRDGDVFLMGEEVAEYQGAYKISQGLLEEFGARRVIDTPITEHGFAGLAVGAAFAGLKPIVEFMTFNFALQAIDHIINSAAKTLYMSGGQMGSPIVFRGPNGAAARVAAQHSHDFAAMYAQVPGLKVVQPYTAADAKGLLKSAIRDPNPVIVLENEILYGRSFDVPELEDFTVPIGKARIAREGNDVTIVSFGIGMTYALQAAEELAKEGISAEVIDLRSLRPMDTETVIASVRKTNRCVTVEEGFPVCSIGNHLSAVLMEKAFDYLDAPVINCTGKDVPMPYAANLEKLALVTTAEVIAAVQGRHLPLRSAHMPINILMPALSPTMEEGTLAKWLVKEGDKVSSGAVIAEIETDKATMEFEAVDEGTVGKIVVPEGTEGVKVNDLIAVLLEEGESADAHRRRAGAKAAGASAPAAAAAPAAAQPAPRRRSAAAAAPRGDGGRVFASPLARRIAAEKGLDLAAIKGSGPERPDREGGRRGGQARRRGRAAAAPPRRPRRRSRRPPPHRRRTPRRSRSSTPTASSRRSSSTGCARPSPRA